MKRTADAANHGTTYWWWLPWLCVPLGSVQLRLQEQDFGKYEMKNEAKYEAKQGERKMKRTADAAKHGTTYQ